MNKLQEDEKYGDENEIQYLDILKSQFGEDVTKIKNKYSTFDFTSESYIYELKSRRNTKNKYPTTMIGLNKLESAKKQNKTVIFIFDFTDKKCYWKYNEKEFKKCNVQVGGRCDRGYVESSMYVYIPIDLLTDF